MSLYEFKGGVLAMNEDVLYSIKFNKEIKFCKSFGDTKMANVFVLNPHHVLIQFKNQNYFEIYDLLDGKLTIRKHFDSEVKFILTNSRDDFMHNMSTTKHSVIIAILNMSEIQSFKFVFEREEKLLFRYRIRPVGLQCHSCAASTVGDDRKVDLYGLTLENGGMLIINKSSNGANSVAYYKVNFIDPIYEIFHFYQLFVYIVSIAIRNLQYIK
jgi:hypothetical protein